MVPKFFFPTRETARRILGLGSAYRYGSRQSALRYFPLEHIVFSDPFASERCPRILGGKEGFKLTYLVPKFFFPTYYLLTYFPTRETARCLPPPHCKSCAMAEAVACAHPLVDHAIVVGANTTLELDGTMGDLAIVS